MYDYILAIIKSAHRLQLESVSTECKFLGKEEPMLN